MLISEPDQADLRVLLVEDDDDDAYLVERALKRMPDLIWMARASNGLEAKTAIETDADDPDRLPNLIILDLNMPVMGGGAFLDWLRAQPQYAGIVVVVLTTVRDMDVLRDMRARGANAALTKDMHDTRDLGQIITDLWAQGYVDSLDRELGMVVAPAAGAA